MKSNQVLTFVADRARLLQLREVGLVAIVAVLFVGFGTIEPLFLHTSNLSVIIESIGILVIVAVGQMLVIATRNIDLSVGSTLGVAAMAVGLAGRDYPATPVIMLILLAVFVGAVLGLINGLVVRFGDVPAIITTLGTLAIFRGLIFLMSGSRQVDPQSVPRGIIELATSPWRGFSWIVIFAILVVAVAWYVTRRTMTGRRLFAIGSNPEAAKARGLRVGAITLGVFVVQGGLAGLGGVLFVARNATVNPADVGLGFELTVITAVVIGGANIFGGSGSVIGTLLGALLVGILANGLNVVGVSGFWQLAAEGALILFAVVTDTLVRARTQRRQAIRHREARWA